MNTTEVKKGKKIKNLLSVIVIGAIGSGLWDILLKKVFFQFGNTFVRIVTFFNNNYTDHIYKDIGKGSIVEIIPFVVIVVSITFAPVFLILRILKFYANTEIPKTNVSNSAKFFAFVFKTKKRAVLFILIISLPLQFVYADLLIKELSTIKAIRYIERSLDIIHPFVKESDYIILKSKYKLIDDKQKLIDILTTFKTIAKENNINLPEYHLYGID
ncbi:MAG: hypothetical protein M0Q26_11360 [Chitinophagaceae bacterium]|nr:hypothetical protein [Chitinophagaceae bacterium]